MPEAIPFLFINVTNYLIIIRIEVHLIIRFSRMEIYLYKNPVNVLCFMCKC